MKDLDDLMMESFVEVVDELRRASGLKHVDFVAKVWPESPQRSAVIRWHNMRSKVRNTGKPQGVLITDAQRMAAALDTEIAYLFLQASQVAKKKAAEQAKAEAAALKKVKPPQQAKKANPKPSGAAKRVKAK